MENKKAWQSKTMWMGLIVAVAPLIPGASDFIQGHEMIVTSGLGILFMALRMISKGKIDIV